MAQIEAEWDDADSWWDDYVQSQESGLIELRELLKELNQMWERSGNQFDKDPLVVDWTETSPQAGPLRTNQEENWSQWFAHLIRDSSGGYTAELFDSRFDRSPTHVRCERAFHDDELHDRRVDILAEFADQGMTVEVKTGDEHYEKTPQTAYLTEKHHQRELDWTHYLLVQQDKQTALQSVFSGQISNPENNRPVISASGPEECDIIVVYWSDVAQALRRTLLAGVESSTHWRASAYLFTTLIEEQILQFYALPSLENYQATSLGISDIERLQSIAPEDQITYLATVLEETIHG